MGGVGEVLDGGGEVGGAWEPEISREGKTMRNRDRGTGTELGFDGFI